ncbi:hypothetical protein [Flavobacterium rhizosphaerae]|uniref:Uncharacterized protein n=1 Tax=Flavobacterium rhizosphaerae TaxID=3163298 RepID=A0ABW8YRD6_9FLAO
MTRSAIIAAMHKWQRYKTDTKVIVNLFNAGNHFFYELPSDYDITDSNYIHAYPGIMNGNLYFFLIPSQYDKPTCQNTFEQYTTACIVTNAVGGGQTMPAPEAQARIDRWILEYPTWIPEQIARPDGIFMGFAIPRTDFGTIGEQGTVYMALRPNDTAGDPDIADMVIATTSSTGSLVYDDSSMPVPPFIPDPSPFSQSSFYLLSL